MSKKNRKDREALIEELVETKARGVVAGIVGREWCEQCGKLGSFSGFCGALGAHLDHHRFTCWKCRTREDRRGLDAVILERGYRYCGGCGREVILEERTVEEARRLPFACLACAGFDRGQEARRRYLEHEASRPGGLEEASRRIRWAKAGLEAILDDQEDAEC